MKRFAKIVDGFQALTISAKQSNLYVWQGFKYASERKSTKWMPEKLKTMRYITYSLMDFIKNVVFQSSFKLFDHSDH